MSNRLIVLAAGALAIVLIAAGCGGEGSDSESITKAEFIKQAETVCTKAKEQASSGFRTFVARHRGNEPKGAALAAAQAKVVETVMVPVKLKEAKQLREIGAPGGDENQVEAIADALVEEAEEAENHPEQAVRGRSSSFAKTETVASEYGLEC